MFVHYTSSSVASVFRNSILCGTAWNKEYHTTPDCIRHLKFVMPSLSPDTHDTTLVLLFRANIHCVISGGKTKPEQKISFRLVRHLIKSWDSAISIATGYGLDTQAIRVWFPVGARIFTSPYCRDLLWGPPSLLSNDYQGVKLTTHHQLVPRSRKWFIHPLAHTSSWHSA
jgi:hypothetical protein